MIYSVFKHKTTDWKTQFTHKRHKWAEIPDIKWLRYRFNKNTIFFSYKKIYIDANQVSNGRFWAENNECVLIGFGAALNACGSDIKACCQLMQNCLNFSSFQSKIKPWFFESLCYLTCKSKNKRINQKKTINTVSFLFVFLIQLRRIIPKQS